MNILIDTISNKTVLILFDNNLEIVEKKVCEIKWNESSELIIKIDELIRNNDLEYKNIKNLIVINWPWSFTGIRSTILTVNTINYIINGNMTALSYFDLFNNYPIIKSSSKKDCFVKFTKDCEIEIIENNELKNILSSKDIKLVYGEANKEYFENIKIIDIIDYISIINNIKMDKAKQLQALYIKKPNIS